jgi:hypothetical protein
LLSLKSITENLARAEKKFLSAADAVPADHWKTRPREECWSAGEVVGHLIMVEQAIIKGADRLLQRPPKPRPFLKRFHIPTWAAESRLIRLKSPIPLDPGSIGEKEAILGQLRTVRERTLAFLEEVRGKDLSNYHMPHPYSWSPKRVRMVPTDCFAQSAPQQTDEGDCGSPTEKRNNFGKVEHIVISFPLCFPFVPVRWWMKKYGKRPILQRVRGMVLGRKFMNGRTERLLQGNYWNK